MTTDLAQGCTDLKSWIDVVLDLITQPDTDASVTHGKPGSRMPGNQAAFNTWTDIHAGVRDLEHDLRYTVTGHTILRGGSDQNTLVAIDVISRFGAAVDQVVAEAAAHQLNRWINAILMLPAVDLEQPWRTIPGGCPRCARPMLRYRERDYGQPAQLACLGCMRQASIVEGHLSDGVVRWEDGEIT